MSTTTTTEEEEPTLDSIIIELNSTNQPITLTKSILILLFTSLTSASPEIEFKALSIIIKLFKGIGGNNSNDKLSIRIYRELIQECLEEEEELEILKGLKSFLILFKSNRKISLNILKDEAIKLTLLELFDTIKIMEESSSKLVEIDKEFIRNELILNFIEFLSLSVGQSIFNNSFQSSIKKWLEYLLSKKLLTTTTKTTTKNEEEATFDSRRENSKLISLISLTLVKLKIGKSKEESEGIGASLSGQQQTTDNSIWKLEKLEKVFVDLIISPTSSTTSSTTTLDYETVLPSLEGLAYLTLLPTSTLKNPLINSKFLTALFSLLPASSSTTTSTSSTSNIPNTNDQSRILEYSIVSLLFNLTSYPSLESQGAKDEEEAQIFRLKSMALGGSSSSSKSAVESKESINLRNKLLVAHSSQSGGTENNLMKNLKTLIPSSSNSTRILIGKIYLNLVEQTSLRTSLIQQGIGYSLLALIRLSLINPSTSNSSRGGFKLETIAPFQALAKILITTSPLLIFPNSEIEVRDRYLKESAGALFLPLVYSRQLELLSSSVGEQGAAGDAGGQIGNLVKFECIMGLTNLSSLDLNLCEFISSLSISSSSSTLSTSITSPSSPSGSSSTTTSEDISLMSILDDLLSKTTNKLLTRTTVELICNLSNSPSGLSYLTSSSTSPSTTTTSSSTKFKPHQTILTLLNILNTSHDIPTLLASSGTFTSLVYYSKDLAVFLSDPKWMELILSLLEDDFLESSEGRGGEKQEAEEEEEERGRKGLKDRGLDILGSIIKHYKESEDGEEKELMLKNLKENNLMNYLIPLGMIWNPDQGMREIAKGLCAELEGILFY